MIIIPEIGFDKEINLLYEDRGFIHHYYTREKINALVNSVVALANEALELMDKNNLSDDFVISYNKLKSDKENSGFYSNGQKSNKNTARIVDLYLIQNTNNKNLKIGISKNVNLRLLSLQSNNSDKLEIISVIKNKSNIERQLHKKFSNLRIYKEWFKYDESIVKHFESL
jgi:hypothetical protein